MDIYMRRCIRKPGYKMIVIPGLLFLAGGLVSCSSDERKQKRFAQTSEVESSDVAKKRKKRGDAKVETEQEQGQILDAAGKAVQVDLGSPEFEVPLRKASQATLKNTVEEVFGVSVDDFPKDRWFGLILENGAKNPIDRPMVSKFLAIANKVSSEASPKLLHSIKSKCQNLPCLKSELLARV